MSLEENKNLQWLIEFEKENLNRHKNELKQLKAKIISIEEKTT